MENLVRHFRHIVLWPLELAALPGNCAIRNHWDILRGSQDAHPWREVADEFTGDPSQFQQRHYIEFVQFLPFVQRFLYGEKGATAAQDHSPIRIFRRHDVDRVRVTLQRGDAPLSLKVAHIDLYFFYDIDVAILVVEVHADDLTLTQAQETIYRLGRAYPDFWEADGKGGHCPVQVDLLTHDGRLLASSDFERRAEYLAYTCAHKAPRVASHWEYLLSPLVPVHDTQKPGQVRYKQIEDHRMPVLSYLAFDDPRALARSDFVRLGLATRSGEPDTLPYAPRFLYDFERTVCYDRYWDDSGPPGRVNTRYLCSGHAFAMIGEAKAPYFTDLETGLLGHFRHQYFLLGLIAHFHKAALLVLSERLSVAVGQLDVTDPRSVRAFSRKVRTTLEVFLRFDNRYWFHEISNQPQAQDLFSLWSRHLGNDRLFEDVRTEVHDINTYLESARNRRMAEAGVRLGVVATFGFIGTVATGFLGMNLIDEAAAPLWLKIVYFFIVLAPMTVLMFYTVSISRGLADFLDVLADSRVTTRQKLRAFARIWISERQ